MTLRYETLHSVKLLEFGTSTFEAENVDILYSDSALSEYSFIVNGSSNYDTDRNNPNLFVTCGLYQWETGYSPIITMSVDGVPIFGQYFESLSIAGKDFNKVYMNQPVDGIEGYGSVYYNAELGMIGFANKNGEIFSLKEIKAN